MKNLLSVAAALAVAFALVASLYAEKKAEGKEVTLKGKITCAKCDLKLTDAKKCATVIQVKGKSEDDKATLYYFDADSNKKYHSDICKEGKAGVVKGTVTKKDGKNTIAITELKYNE